MLSLLRYSEGGVILGEKQYAVIPGQTIEEFFLLHNLDHEEYYITTRGKRPLSTDVVSPGQLICIQEVERALVAA